MDERRPGLTVASPYQVVFLDLDDTLYPSSTGLWQAIGDRILSYMVEVAGVPAERAGALRDEYFRDYGTTLAGLRLHQGIDPLDYLRYVHDLPLERYLAPDPAVRAVLAAVPLRRIVFTNADRGHADRVLARLNLTDVIDQIIDVIDVGWTPKPAEEAYTRALAAAHEKDPKACLLLDDLARNILPAERLGMTGVLVGRKASADGVRHQIDSIVDLPALLMSLGVPFPKGAA